jgi:hypothetical protein
MSAWKGVKLLACPGRPHVSVRPWVRCMWSLRYRHTVISTQIGLQAKHLEMPETQYQHFNRNVLCSRCRHAGADTCPQLLYSPIRLGGVMVSVLAITPKIRGFKPGWGYGFLRVINIRSTTFFGGELKPYAPCWKILRNVNKSLAGINKNTSQRQIYHSLRPFLLLATR